MPDRHRFTPSCLEHAMHSSTAEPMPITVVQGNIRSISTARASGPVLDLLTERTRNTWIAGNFDRIAQYTAPGAQQFIERLGIRAGERVLDVACGSGNLAVPAARAGAVVTGVDIAPNLVAIARKRAIAEGLEIRFEEGDAEGLPYPSGSFDTVVTMFGAMFAPRPERAAAELIRVTRPGGRIAMANWTSDGYISRMFRTTAAFLPPHTDAPSPLLWGDPHQIAVRLGGRVRVLSIIPRTITFDYPYSPAGVVELFQAFYGPTVRAFEALEPEARAVLRRELERLWREANLATDGGTRIEAEYMEVVAIVE
jgi:SAM-dependent methyltransferase